MNSTALVLEVKPSVGNVVAQTWAADIVLLLWLGIGAFVVSDRGAVETFQLGLMFVFLAGLVGVLWRATRSYLFADENSIRIRNFWGGYELTWNQIAMVGWEHYSVGFRGEFPTRCVTFWLATKDMPLQPVTLQAKAKVTSS